MSRVRGLLIATALLAAITSTLRVYPHQLAYFNELAGGPENGHTHLLGSNLEFGQDLLTLNDIGLDPNVRMQINVFGVSEFDPPNSTHIDVRSVPAAFRLTAQYPRHTARTWPDEEPGVLVLGARALMQPELEAVRHLIVERAERIGYSLFVIRNFPPGPPALQP
ncbi:MAG: hypothetical protein KF861_04090 [Planctomycetaceae bacterium]|nr:hypothetical protein [Planctomycetaceae bacterium]